MLIIIGALYNVTLPYIDTLKKQLASKGFSSLTILLSPNFSHPVAVVILAAFGLFTIPKDPLFFVMWSSMVSLYAISLTLNIWGLLHTKFFVVQILNKLGFLFSTLLAVILLGDHINPLQLVALGLGTLGIICFAWPEKITLDALAWDKGVIFVLISLTLSSVASILYKLASLHVTSYTSFLTGRLLGDMLAWGVIWFVTLTFFMRHNPVLELKNYLKDRDGLLMTMSGGLSALVGSWLVYILPVSTLAVLSTLTIPSSYFWSHYKYNERLIPRQWIGAACIVFAVILFIFGIVY